MEILRKNQEEILQIKNTVTEMKNALISRLNTAEKKSELKDIVIETSKTKKQREQRVKRIKQTIQSLGDNYKRSNKHII